MALFFRDLGHDKVKVSFRSTGHVDVNNFAKQFAGGGHARAAGALVFGGIGLLLALIMAWFLLLGRYPPSTIFVALGTLTGAYAADRLARGAKIAARLREDFRQIPDLLQQPLPEPEPLVPEGEREVEPDQMGLFGG